MRIRFMKYGKSAKLPGGGMEHMEVSFELRPEEDPDEALSRAKEFVANGLLDAKPKDAAAPTPEN